MPRDRFRPLVRGIANNYLHYLSSAHGWTCTLRCHTFFVGDDASSIGFLFSVRGCGIPRVFVVKNRGVS